MVIGPRPSGVSPFPKYREINHTRRLDIIRLDIIMRSIVLAVLVVSVQSLLGKPVDSQVPYNIILVTPDQLGAEYMHTYGHPLPNTPNIDKLADQGTLFLRAYTPGTWTTPSFGALLTGLFPTVHGMTLATYPACGLSIIHPLITGDIPELPAYVNLSLNKPIIPELLKTHGMITAADNSNCWAFFDVAHRGWDSFKFFPGFQGWGLDTQKEDPFYNTAPRTLSWAKGWLAAHRDQRFFLWVHFMEPHTPYNPPREYDRFRTPNDFPDLYDDNANDREKLHSLARLGDARAICRLRQLYSAKILYVDQYIGELMKAIHDLGLDGKTIVIFTADHGELVYSHPEDYNCTDHTFLYDTNVHIPLIFRGPGIPAGRVVNTLVSHYDLLPTILDLESLPPLTKADGVSYKQVVLGSTPMQVHDYVYGHQIEILPAFSVRDERYKLIESLRTGEITCFDGLSDPGEKKSMCEEIPQIAAKLKKVLDLHMQTVIRESKSYPDWEDNLALAVVMERDSRGLLLLAPRDAVIGPDSGTAQFQLNGRGLWSASGDRDCIAGPCYWAPPGRGEASAIWRTEMPLTGEYEISFRYGGAAQPTQRLATNANLIVRFRGGSLAFPVDQNLNQGRWNLLGRFDHPISVTLTNLADGPVVAGAIRFLRLEEKPVLSH